MNRTINARLDKFYITLLENMAFSQSCNLSADQFNTEKHIRVQS